MGKLRVTVIRGSLELMYGNNGNIVTLRCFNNLDSFVEISLGEKTVRTKTAKGTYPEWGESFFFEYSFLAKFIYIRHAKPETASVLFSLHTGLSTTGEASFSLEALPRCEPQGNFNAQITENNSGKYHCSESHHQR
jgi:hypothetical protein